MYIVDVDHGILNGGGIGVRKCDFLSYGLQSANTHLIELKGKEIDEAYKQLMETIYNLSAHNHYQSLVNERDRIDAFIVSPNMQNIPSGLNPNERKLAGLLFNRSREKVENMYDLVQYVRVVPKQNVLSRSNRRIICSGKAPLPLE